MFVSGITSSINAIPSIGRIVNFSEPSRFSISEIIQKNAKIRLAHFKFSVGCQTTTDKKTSRASRPNILKLDQDFEKIIARKSLFPISLINNELSKLFSKYLELAEIEQAAHVLDQISHEGKLKDALKNAMQCYYPSSQRALRLKQVFGIFMAQGTEWAIYKAVIIASHIVEPDIDSKKMTEYLSREYNKACKIQAFAYTELCHHYLQMGEPLYAIHYSEYSKNKAGVFFEAIQLLIKLGELHEAFIQAKAYYCNSDEGILILAQIYNQFLLSNQLAESEEILQELFKVLYNKYRHKEIFQILLYLGLTDIAESFSSTFSIEMQSLALAELFKEYMLRRKDLNSGTVIAKKIENTRIRDLALTEVYKAHSLLEQFLEASEIESQISRAELCRHADGELRAFFKMEGKNHRASQIAMRELNRIKEQCTDDASTLQLDLCCSEASDIYFGIEEYDKAIQFAKAIQIKKRKINQFIILSRGFLGENELSDSRKMASHALKCASSNKTFLEYTIKKLNEVLGETQVNELLVNISL